MINKKRYTKQHIIPLEEVKLENIEDDGGNLVYFGYDVNFFFEILMHSKAKLSSD